MSEPYVGQIIMFAGNFAPRGWAFCDGQLLAISQNDALFSLLGTTYGGDGRSTFGLPDLRGRIPIHTGAGPGLSQRRLGEEAGAEQVALSAVMDIPSHGHTANAAAGGDSAAPAGNMWGTDPAGFSMAYNTAANAQMSSMAISSTGSGLPHNNMQPSLGINYIISLVGVYPSRN